MRTSYSALQTYKLCPQKFKFQELDRVPARKSSAALFGTRVHSAIRYMFSPTPLFPTLEEVLAYFREQWLAEDARIVPEERELYRSEGERILKTFYARNPPWSAPVVDLEVRFEVLIEDPRARETHVLAGRIDRIDKTPEGFEVLDYKTSRRMPAQAAVDGDLQLSIYSLGLQKRWPHVSADQIVLSLYFLRHGEKLSTRRSAADTERTHEEVLATVSEIRERVASGGRFEPRPGPHCALCPYRPICPAWKHLYRRDPAAVDQVEIESALREYFEVSKRQRRDEARLAELRATLRSHMEALGFDRIFGDEGFLTRSVQRRFGYDFEKVRAILQPLGKWDEILSADAQKLSAVLRTLSPETRAQIENARVLTREYVVISASTKRISPPRGGADGSASEPPAPSA